MMHVLKAATAQQNADGVFHSSRQRAI